MKLVLERLCCVKKYINLLKGKSYREQAAYCCNNKRIIIIKKKKTNEQLI